MGRKQISCYVDGVALILLLLQTVSVCFLGQGTKGMTGGVACGPV